MITPSAEVDQMMAVIRAMDRPRVPALRALGKYPRLFIYGGPGSGKSTLLGIVAGLVELPVVGVVVVVGSALLLLEGELLAVPGSAAPPPASPPW